MVECLIDRAAFFLLIHSCNRGGGLCLKWHILRRQQYEKTNATFTCCGVCVGSQRWGCSQAHGATLALWSHSFLTVAEVLTYHVFTSGGPHIAHTDPTRLWVPHVVVGVDFSIFCAGIFEKQKREEIKLVTRVVWGFTVKENHYLTWNMVSTFQKLKRKSSTFLLFEAFLPRVMRELMRCSCLYA